MDNKAIISQIIDQAEKTHINLSPSELIDYALERKEGKLTDMGALAADTGEFTGRSPKDKFVVKDVFTEKKVWWGDINHPISTEKFEGLLHKILKHYRRKELFIRDAFVCSDLDYQMSIKVVTETAYQNLFANNLFQRFKDNSFREDADWIILAAPSFMAVAAEDGTRQHNFSITNFSKKIILIGGTGYTGEIKKGIFTVLNFTLPKEHGVLSMHCSANEGKNGDTAVFFGLSGTGKTTLSADPNRKLIGDDEHGWSENSVFNFEGGCYAKCIDLSEEKEPQIYQAIKKGALVENVRFFEGSNKVNFEDIRVTQNTRVAYPIEHIEGVKLPSIGNPPKNIFFLTCDAFGVLPPISKLTAGQAMYHFISGYTAKVAGTEEGINEPKATFSACFGEAFLPLHPSEYANMLGEKLKANPEINVWLINTGWSGGEYGVGQRMKLKYTRAMITAALEGKLAHAEYHNQELFGLAMPVKVDGVPSELLNPIDTWQDKQKFTEICQKLAHLFNENFEKYSEGCSSETIAAAPKLQTRAKV